MIITTSKILLQLPLKTLIPFRNISLELHNWISSSYFIKMQVYYTIQTKTHSEILIHHKDYNGFLQIFTTIFKNKVLGNAVEIYPPLRSANANSVTNDRTQFVIWNPFIRRYIISSEEFISNPFKLEFETKSMFGYDVVNDDYEVLRVVEFQKKRPEVKMYSLNMHSWKQIQEVWPATNLGVNWSHSICVNGSLHWLLLE